MNLDFEKLAVEIEAITRKHDSQFYERHTSQL